MINWRSRDHKPRDKSIIFAISYPCVADKIPETCEALYGVVEYLPDGKWAIRPHKSFGAQPLFSWQYVWGWCPAGDIPLPSTHIKKGPEV